MAKTMDEKTLSPYQKYVRERLEHWANWYSRGNYLGLGYPSCSMEYRLMKEGIVHRNLKTKTVSSNQSAEEIEAIVKDLALEYAEVALVVRAHYFNSGSIRDKTKMLTRCHYRISHMHFANRLSMGHCWIEGRLKNHKKIAVIF